MLLRLRPADRRPPRTRQRAAVWSAKLDTEPASRAAMVLLAGYGPGGRNLRDAAQATGLIEEAGADRG